MTIGLSSLRQSKMRKVKSVTVILSFLCVFLAVGAVFGVIRMEITIPSKGTILTGNFDYAVMALNGNYTAVNDEGQTVAAGVLASTVINSVFNMMNPGESLSLKGYFPITSTITPRAGIYMNCTSATLVAQNRMDYLLSFANKDVLTVDGGTWDGNGKCGTAIRSYFADQIIVKNANFGNFQQGWGTPVINLNNGLNHIVENNTFNNNPSCWAIVLNNGGNSRVLNNFINCNNNGSGIGIFCSSEAYTSNEIANNLVRDWSDMLWHAIYIDGCPNTTIHDNDVAAPLAGGGPILVKANSQIFNNIIGSSKSYGISLYPSESGASYGNPSGSRIWNNSITSNTVGISLIGVSNVEVWSNRITSNRTESTGILFSVSKNILDNITIRDNFIHDIPCGIRFGFWGDTLNASNLVIARNNFVFISVSPVMTIQSLTTVNTTIAYNDFNEAIASPLTDHGFNTMIYDNIGLADNNIPSNKIFLPPL